MRTRRDPDVGGPGLVHDRSEQHLPLATYTPREDHRVLVLRWYHDPDSLDAMEVPGGRQVHTWSATSVGSAGDDIGVQFAQIRQPGILEAPLAGDVVTFAGE